MHILKKHTRGWKLEHILMYLSIGKLLHRSIKVSEIMTRDFFAISLSTVASESTFSMVRRIISDYCSSLKLKILEALICVQDWLRPYFCDEGEDGMMTLRMKEEMLLLLLFFFFCLEINYHILYMFSFFVVLS